MSFPDALNSSLNLTTLSLAANLMKRSSGQMTSERPGSPVHYPHPLSPETWRTGSLWIVTDGAVQKPEIGTTPYVTRDGRLRLAGFFSAKLHGSQTAWLPCEVEALAIAVATMHFSPYIIQSLHKACILTDRKPCIQAYEKHC